MERYTYTITNQSDQDKVVRYFLRTDSHVWLEYQVGKEEDWQTRIKIGDYPRGDNESDDAFTARTTREMFSFEIGQNETKEVTVEVLLTNADHGGIGHRMTVENAQ